MDYGGYQSNVYPKTASTNYVHCKSYLSLARDTKWSIIVHDGYIIKLYLRGLVDTITYINETAYIQQ